MTFNGFAELVGSSSRIISDVRATGRRPLKGGVPKGSIAHEEMSEGLVGVAPQQHTGSVRILHHREAFARHRVAGMIAFQIVW